MSKSIKAVEAEHRRLSAILMRARSREERKANKQLIGRYFVYQNSYGVADGMREWPMYFRIEGMDKEGCLIGTTFQTTPSQIEINAHKFLSYIHPGNGHREISRKDFDRALKDLKRRIKEI